MPEGSEPYLPLIVGSDNQVLFVGNCAWKSRFGRAEPSSLYVVVHRGRPPRPGLSPEPWTHIYRVAQDPSSRRALVYLEATLEGACVDKGRDKALRMLDDQMRHQRGDGLSSVAQVLSRTAA
ncbi:hypothetical protein [Microvirga alba]|uniref:Uncharacterized protein n=1 Tax=Microvirga alba TaxID=2791025 RepID=A0A931FQX4_9HYPH|nr:hypothetical protein [Microvirga alba]MBF9232206.1 hypothetical protein [Microvirga alba]